MKTVWNGIYIPTFADLELPDASHVRPDGQDCADYTEQVADRLRSVDLGAIFEDRIRVYDPTAIAGSEYGSTTSTSGQGGWYRPGNNGGSCPPVPNTRDGGTPQPGCPPKNSCGDVPMPVNTIGKTGYPVVGTGLGTLVTGPQVSYKSQRAQLYYPEKLYVRALDQLNGFAEIEGFMVQPTNAGNPQILSATAGIDGALPTAVNSFGFGPYRIDNWRVITNTEPNFLTTQFGHIYANSTSAQFVGLMFGRASFDPGQPGF